MIDRDTLIKIKKRLTEGRKYSEIAQEVQLSSSYIAHIARNMSFYERKLNMLEEEIEKKSGRKILKLIITEKDYAIFLKIKEELNKRLEVGNISDEFVFLKLLHFYDEFKKKEVKE